MNQVHRAAEGNIGRWVQGLELDNFDRHKEDVFTIYGIRVRGDVYKKLFWVWVAFRFNKTNLLTFQHQHEHMGAFKELVLGISLK